MGLLSLLARCLALAAGSAASAAVLLVALIYGLHEESALRPGRGVEVPSTLYGQNVIVTGSSSGIGFEAALEFYKLGAHVVVHGSSHERAVKTVADIERLGAEGRGFAKATPLGADLGDFDEVRSFATTAKAILPAVDILVLNAAKMYGLGPMYGGKSLQNQPDSAFPARSGHDRVLSVNHLGHFLLAELLLPHLAFGARILVMTSIGSWGASYDRLMPPWGSIGKYRLSPKSANEKRIIWERGLKPQAHLAYRDSKLANVCFGRHLRRRLGEDATVLIHDPGLVMTTPAMSRDSQEYKQRLNRQRRSAGFHNWHAPAEDGGRHVLESVFLTRRPVPDVVVSYFFPRQLVSWFLGAASQVARYRFLGPVPSYQKLFWGLHSTIGPECDEGMQERLANWSAHAVGLVL